MKGLVGLFRLFKKLYSYFRPYRWLFGAGFLFLLIMQSMVYLVPQGVRVIWDRIFPNLKEPGAVMSLFLWCGLLVLIALTRALFSFGMIFCFWSTGVKVVNDLRNQLYRKLQRLSFSFYNTARTGDIMSRLTLDIEMIRNFYAYQIEHRTQIYLYFSVVTILLFWSDWKLALVCLAATPAAVGAVFIFSRKIRRAVKQRQVQAGILNATVQENIAGIRVVKAFAMEDIETRKFTIENRKMRECNLEVSKLQVALHPFLVLCSNLGTLAILWYGGTRVARGSLSLGTLVAFMSYLAVLNWPIWNLAHNINQLRQTEGATARLRELMEREEEIRPPADGGIIIPKLQGRIAFQNVSFGYAGEAVLKGINLTVEPGEKVAVIGLTGSGKSTLINLIPRFYDPWGGQIQVDGVDLRQFNLEWWRRQVGLVHQETFLFSATIYDNIAFGKPEAGPDEVRAAAEAARIAEFIDSLPQGYETIIGERGVGLSGGQKQRVAIARALLMDPKVLILDDSTSNVDVHTEQAIQESLRQLMAGRTAILITQRLSTAQLADRVVILESGEIRDQGSHEELIERDDFYQQLYQIQTFQEETPEVSA